VVLHIVKRAVLRKPIEKCANLIFRGHRQPSRR
jgi:hypothetical protein